jgi:hypothetical protein
MKKQVINCVSLLLFYFINTNVFAQQKSNENNTTKIAFSEKIYLQLNSNVFTSDQTVWFKAIVTNVNHNPTSLSNVLHVDLINFDERIVASKLLKIENGAADSFFELQELAPLSSGRYMIRAYTKWNTNFKENKNDFISKKYITIYKPREIRKNEEPIRDLVISEKEDKQLELSARIFPRIINPKFKGNLNVSLNIDGKKQSIKASKNNDKDKSYTINYPLPKNAVKAKIDVQLDSIRIKNFDFKTFNSFSKTIAVDKNFIDLQFFPEGGKLVDGLTSIVGFKALDYKNEGLPVHGFIKDKNGKVITQFKSNELGMGFFELKTTLNEIFHAQILLDDNIQYRFNLPKVHKKGYVLTAKQDKNFFKIDIKSSFSFKDSLSIKAQAKGITYANTKLQCKKGKISMAYNKKLFPEGIVTFTVFNQLNQPICERLIFNYKENNNRLKISSKTDKRRYLQRDKIVFDINIKNKDSLQQKNNTSFLVINKKQLGEMQLKRGNILSYFLLESELKGSIEKPNFYFDTNNKRRFYAMDALLLTQGWRNYVYKPVENEEKFKIAPEKGLQISGNIEEYVKRRRKKPVQLTLIAKGKENLQATVSHVDSLGKFSFALQDIYNDDLEYIIQTKNHKGKKKELTVNIDKQKALPINFKKQEELQLADQYKIYLAENRKRYAIENPFSVGKNGFALDEVVVKTRLLNSIQEKMNKEHGEPDVVIEKEELKAKNEKWMSGLYSLLKFKYPNDVRILTSNSRTLGNFQLLKVYETDFTFVIVDGKPVILRDYHLLENIPIEEVKSVEITKFPYKQDMYHYEVFGRYVIRIAGKPQFSFLNIYSHSGIGLYGIINSSIGIFKNTLPSFSTKKEFYTPKHENLVKSDWDITDLRSTVFWKPNVKLNKNGNAKVEYYNDDNIGEMLVIIESISNDGKIGYYQTTYKVNERLVKRDIK